MNRGRLRALLSSGQAAVVHRLAVASKDGDWILREDDEATQHVLDVLGAHGALDRERRRLMRANEARLATYRAAYRDRAAIWPDVQREIESLPLSRAHEVVVRRAAGVLPVRPSEPQP